MDVKVRWHRWRICDTAKEDAVFNKETTWNDFTKALHRLRPMSSFMISLVPP